MAYAKLVCDHRPIKKEKFRVRLTLGGDVLEYDGNASSSAASLLEVKLLFNGVLSDADKGARFISVGLKDSFLQSFLEEPEYIQIHSKYFLPDIRSKYTIEFLSPIFLRRTRVYTDLQYIFFPDIIVSR